jgi:hypothetical protein
MYEFYLEKRGGNRNSRIYDLTRHYTFLNKVDSYVNKHRFLTDKVDNLF